MSLEVSSRRYARPTFDSIFKRVFGTEKGKPALLDLLQRTQAKLHMLSDDQLEQQILMLHDYPDQESFESAIQALKVVVET